MNVLIKNKKIERRPVNRQLNAEAKAWLAEFPNNAVVQMPTVDTGSGRSAVHTSTASSFLFNSTHTLESHVILVISIGRGYASTEVGLAAINVHSPSLILSQFSDDLWFNGLMTKISVYTPKELLLPSTLCDVQPPPKILTFIRNNFPDLTVVPMDRSRFNSHQGIAKLQHVCGTKYVQLLQKNTKLYYAMASAAALLDYVQHHIVKAQFGEKSLRVEFESKFGSMQIDVESAHRLELLYPLYPSPEKRTCLYGVLNTCITRIGQRNLRAKVLQPSRDLSEIRTMHECVAEMRGKDGLIGALQVCLKPYASVDRLIRIAYVMPPNKEDNYRVSEILINQALQLKSCLDSIPELFQLLSELNGTVFAQIREGLQDPRYPYLAKKIYDVLEPNSTVPNYGNTYFFQRLFAVRSGINGMLDLNRTIYSALIDDIREEVDRLKDLYNLPLRMGHSKTRGFHVQLPLRGGFALKRIESELEVLCKSKTMLQLTNETLCNLNIRIKKYIDEIHFTSTAILDNLLQQVRKEMDTIYDLSGYISELDITMAIVLLSLNSDYTCPTFGDELRVIQGIHPFLEYASHKTHPRPVPNNVLATAEYNFFIITGPNMAGKTIYLKMIALLQIMAQIGCYVPAKSAQFRLCDKVFTRMGFNDSIEQNASSFVVEMREMDYILKSMTPNSLVIIDELCRSTNHTDGQRIAWKICERMVALNGPKMQQVYHDEANEEVSTHQTTGNTTAPYIFFTTHFHELCKLYEKHLNVVNLNFVATESQNAENKLHLTYTHLLEEGATKIKGYGLALARTVRFPPSIIPRAEQLHAYLMRNEPLPNVPKPSQRPTIVPYSRTSSLPRSRSSNPINRTYSHTSSHAIHSTPRSLVNICEDTRDMYDLYANLMETIRSQDEDWWLRTINELLEQFLINCEPEFVRLVQNEHISVLLNQFLPQSEPVPVPRSQASSSSKHDRSVTFSENIMFKDIVAYDCENEPEPYVDGSNIVLQSPNHSFQPQTSSSSRNLTHSSRIDSQHSLVSNLNFHERRLNYLFNRSNASSVGDNPLRGRQASDTETNLSGPSFKSFLRGFAQPKKPQIVMKPDIPIRTRSSFPDYESSQLLSTSNRRTEANQFHDPILSSSSGPSNNHALKDSNMFYNPSPVNSINRKAINYFAGVPDDFWKSVNEFENGNQYQELRDFINEGIPSIADARSHSNEHLPAVTEHPDHNTSANSSRSSHKRSVSFADEQPSWNPPCVHRPTPTESIVTPNIFERLDNFIAQERGSRFTQSSPSPLKRYRRDGLEPILFGAPSQSPSQMNTQNTINFLVEFESSLTSSPTPMRQQLNPDPFCSPVAVLNPTNPYYHSIFDTTPTQNPMEVDDIDHGTQSRDTKSSFDEMDPTQNVIALLSQCSPPDAEDMFYQTPSQSQGRYHFKSPAPLPRKPPEPSYLTNSQNAVPVFLTPQPPRAIICPSPTQSENQHRLDEYLTSQYERAVVNPVASSNETTSLPEQFPEISTSFQSKIVSPETPRRAPTMVDNDDDAFRTPRNRQIRMSTTMGTADSVANSLRRYIDSNRDSDEEEEDMFAGSGDRMVVEPVWANRGGEQKSTPIPFPDSSMVMEVVDVIIPAPEGFN